MTGVDLKRAGLQHEFPGLKMSPIVVLGYTTHYSNHLCCQTMMDFPTMKISSSVTCP